MVPVVKRHSDGSPYVGAVSDCQCHHNSVEVTGNIVVVHRGDNAVDDIEE